jgi:predicted Fe-Mo cluster-binding NifX family protein
MKMLVMISADGNTLGSQISKRFGQASYYIVYDTDSELFDAIKNDHVEEAGTNAADEHANLRDFLKKGVKAFIVGNIGPVAFQTIKTPETKVWLARKMTAGEAIKRFISGELSELSGPTAKRSIGGHGKSK